MKHFKHLQRILPALATGLLWAACAAHAADTPPAPPADGQPPSPPPEAIAACQGKSAGDQVSFTGRRGETLQGVCELRNGVLAARPSRRPDGQPPRR
jgi:hypothetical protein